MGFRTHPIVILAAQVAVRVALCLFITAGVSSQSPPLEVDRKASRIVVVTGRAGALGFLGHDHAIIADQWSADLQLDQRNPERSTIAVTVQAASLGLASPEVHGELGLSRDRPDADDIREIESKMKGERILDSAQHPQIRFHSTNIEQTGEQKFAVSGPLTIRGRTQQVTIPVEVEQQEGMLAFSGSFEVSQREFGIEPESLAGGMVRVANDVEVRFRIQARMPGGL